MIKKKILAVMILSLLFLAPTFACLAVEDYGAGAVAGVAGIGTSVAGESSVEGLTGKVVAMALSFVGVVFFLLILYAGFTWMTAMGNTEATTKAKNIIEAAVIGLVLVSAAYAISSFVFSSLEGGGSTTNTSPTSATECKKMGDKCGSDFNMKCDTNLNCVSLCEIEYADKGGECIDTLMCDTASMQFEIIPGKCPGAATNICCVSK